MTPRKPLDELEADEFVCVRCQAVSQEHPLDGMGECPDCVRRYGSPQEATDGR